MTFVSRQIPGLMNPLPNLPVRGESFLDRVPGIGYNPGVV